MANKTGKAYAFFDCRAPKYKIERELPFIRECVQTPNELELSLTEGAGAFLVKKTIDCLKLKGDPQLLQIALDATLARSNHVIEATCPNATNHQTADELAGILNQAYQSPLYQDKEEFRGGIVYEENGGYVERE